VSADGVGPTHARARSPARSESDVIIYMHAYNMCARIFAQDVRVRPAWRAKFIIGSSRAV
jgi:hypothetical protein